MPNTYGGGGGKDAGEKPTFAGYRFITVAKVEDT